jgi:sugar phosphate isomerase/epimerase
MCLQVAASGLGPAIEKIDLQGRDAGMGHARLSVDAMCTYPWSFDRDLALWTDLELRHAGLLISKLGPDPAANMARLAAAGIRATTLIVPSFDLAAPETWAGTRAEQRAAIDLMARHGGQSIYFTPGRTTGAPWREDCDRLAEALGPTVAHARAAGLRAAIEPSLRTSVSFVNTLRDAIDVAERTGIGLVADFGNMWMERDFREVVARAMPHVALVQICDVVIGAGGLGARPGRTHVGAGELPLRRLLTDVLDAGYTGVFDLEVVPPDFTQGCDEPAIRQGIAAAAALLTDLGI